MAAPGFDALEVTTLARAWPGGPILWLKPQGTSPSFLAWSGLKTLLGSAQADLYGSVRSRNGVLRLHDTDRSQRTELGRRRSVRFGRRVWVSGRSAGVGRRSQSDPRPLAQIAYLEIRNADAVLETDIRVPGEVPDGKPPPDIHAPIVPERTAIEAKRPPAIA